MNLFSLLFVTLLPGIIASQIAEGNGFHPAIGFAIGAVFSWPGMVMVAIASGMLGDRGRRRTASRRRSSSPATPTGRRDMVTRPSARKRALTPDEIHAGSLEARTQKLRAERERLAALQREAEIIRHNAKVERRQSAAALAARDELLAAREAEIQGLRSALDQAEVDRERELIERDPWYRETIAPAEEALRESLPDSLPADMPRQSFHAPPEAPRTLAAGAEGDAAD